MQHSYRTYSHVLLFYKYFCNWHFRTPGTGMVHVFLLRMRKMANERYKYRRDILHYLCRHPGKTSEEIAAGTRHPLNYIMTVLPAMFTDGLLLRKGEPGKFCYSPGKRSRARSSSPAKSNDGKETRHSRSDPKGSDRQITRTKPVMK